MRSFVYLSGVFEITVVEHIGEDSLHPVHVPSFSSTCCALPAITTNAVFVQKSSNVFKACIACGIHFKSSADDRCLLIVFGTLFQSIEAAQGCEAQERGMSPFDAK